MDYNAATDELTIWRYMDLSKFVWMLSERSLRFTKLRLYEDKYEGYCDVKPRVMPLEDDGPELIKYLRTE